MATLFGLILFGILLPSAAMAKQFMLVVHPPTLPQPAVGHWGET